MGVVAGLPPRGRGREPLASRAPLHPRITPAWAGKSVGAGDFERLLGDYPRVGGEEGLSRRACPAREGLPPRGRGRVEQGRIWLPTKGITPAWAGKRPPAPKSTPPHRDYPRVGGEELNILVVFRNLCGLPPRGRGRGIMKMVLWHALRITPAWAGKSLFHVRTAIKRPDYPRVGGEEKRISAERKSRHGLPPRGRGRGASDFSVRPIPGITPAWAGKRRV